MMMYAREIFKLSYRLWLHLSKRRRFQFVALLAVMLVSAFAEVISLGAVLPFLAILTAPEKIFGYPLVASVARTWGIASPQQLVMPLTAAFALAALLAGMARILLLWANTRVSYGSASDLSLDLYRRSLYQPYSVHIARNSSEVISAVTYKVNEVAFGVLQAVPTLISSMVLLVAILCTLVVINPIVAIAAAVGFGFCYGLISFISRRQLHIDSQRISCEQTQIIKALQEGLGSIRDVLLDGTQPVFCDVFRKAEIPLRRAQGNTLFISVSPRYAVEALGMVMIAILAYQLSGQSGGVSSALPVLGALALGAQRMLPALQQMYTSWTNIQSSQASLGAIIDLLNQPMPSHSFEINQFPLEFKKAIRFQDVAFRYANEGPMVLEGLSLIITKGARVGIVGSTGSGKSTMLDILIGLLEPTCGEMLVDDLPLTELRRQAWQRMIAHVPQNIYLTDATVAENIAFGIPFPEIDMERVRLAAQQAQIDAFITSRPNGYLALLGERGISLSGGQRQRIGIARALYKKAAILVFDEATSALDNETEEAVMQAIEGLSQELTVVIIAHRLTTLKNCTQIVELADGGIKKVGTYQNIIEHKANR